MIQKSDGIDIGIFIPVFEYANQTIFGWSALSEQSGNNKDVGSSREEWKLIWE